MYILFFALCIVCKRNVRRNTRLNLDVQCKCASGTAIVYQNLWFWFGPSFKKILGELKSQLGLRLEKAAVTSMATIGDEDSATQSSRSSPSTPSISNPGTPRSELTQEVRATPPLPQPPISSSVQRTIPGQLQAQQAQVLVAQSHIQQQQQALHQLVHQPQSKYSSLLAVIEDMGRDIRPTYAGNRTSSERLKRSIVHARILVRECLMECERSART